MSARDKLLAFTKPQMVETRIKALGEDPIFIRKLTMAEARKLHNSSQKPGDAQGRASSEMLSKSICDADGKGLLTTDQIDSLVGDVAAELLEAVLLANGLGKKADEGNDE